MKKTVFILLFAALPLFSEPLIETDIPPDTRIKNIRSIALFRFDGKLINSGRTGLADYLQISENFHRILMERFYARNRITVIDAGESAGYTETDTLAAVRGDGTPSYDEKTLKHSRVIAQDPVKAPDAFLYGKITRFYEGESFETSYIELTLFLVESRSRIIRWTASVKGCAKFAARTIADTLADGKLSEPSGDEQEEFRWINPYTQRITSLGLGYGLGYLANLGAFGERVGNGFTHHLFFDFTPPLWSGLPLYNQVELMLMPALGSEVSEHMYHTYLPLLFNFIYPFGKSSLAPFVKAGLGAGFESVYYSGLGVARDSLMKFHALVSAGAGVKYDIPLGWIRVFNHYFKLNRIGLLAQVNFYHWFIPSYSASSLDFTLGLKYYF